MNTPKKKKTVYNTFSLWCLFCTKVSLACCSLFVPQIWRFEEPLTHKLSHTVYQYQSRWHTGPHGVRQTTIPHTDYLCASHSMWATSKPSIECKCLNTGAKAKTWRHSSKERLNVLTLSCRGLLALYMCVCERETELTCLMFMRELMGFRESYVRVHEVSWGTPSSDKSLLFKQSACQRVICSLVG